MIKEIVVVGGFILGISLLSFFMLSVFFGEQETEILTNLSCEELRECIFLETSCYEIIIHNSFLGFEWDVDSVRTLYYQKQEYKENCIFKTHLSGKEKDGV